MTGKQHMMLIYTHESMTHLTRSPLIINKEMTIFNWNHISYCFDLCPYELKEQKKIFFILCFCREEKKSLIFLTTKYVRNFDFFNSDCCKRFSL